MIIGKNKVVSIEYTLKDSTGEVVDSSEGHAPLDYIHGAQNIIPGLEKELEGKKAGDKLSVVVEPADGYGEYSKDLVIEVSKEQFPADAEIEEGMQFEADSETGGRLVTVVAVSDKTITIDANHPLAGEKLFFDVTVAAVREATDEEIAKGLFAHSSCGCGDDDDCDCGDDDCGCSSGGCGSGGCGCH